MKSLHLPLIAACVAVVGAPAFAQGVVINEFSYDDSGTDDREFVELYNASSAAIDIGDWTLEANDENTPNASYTVPTGTMLAPGGFWVIGSSLVPGVNQNVGLQDLWQNDMETLELYDATRNLVDAVVYEVNKQLFTIAPAVRAQVGEGLWGNFASIDGGDTSWARNRDGYDTDNNGRDFRVINSTPGATNDVPNLFTYIENFDALPIDTAVPNWGRSFVDAKVIDPQQLVGGNTSIIPPSPQGGQALLCWDPAGGGNCAMLVTDVAENVVFECYAYFDALPEPAGEYETWAIGVQGTAPTYYNTPDLGGVTTGFTANGCTGVSLTYRCDEFGGTLYLIDHNDGGVGPNAIDGPTILGQIAIQSGVNDGWQRIRLQAGSGVAEAYFGGTIGLLDGQRIGGRMADGAPGGIYIGYREFLAANGSVRPPTLDFVIIRGGNADVDYIGAATPNSSATPVISSNGLPNIGDMNFAVTAAGLVPSSNALAVIGFAPFNPPLNLQVAGAQPGSELYVMGALSAGMTTNAVGEATLPLAIPADPNLNNQGLYFQIFQIDRGLSFPLPIAQSEGMQLTFGQ